MPIWIEIYVKRHSVKLLFLNLRSYFFCCTSILLVYNLQDCALRERDKQSSNLNIVFSKVYWFREFLKLVTSCDSWKILYYQEIDSPWIKILQSIHNWERIKLWVKFLNGITIEVDAAEIYDSWKKMETRSDSLLTSEIYQIMFWVSGSLDHLKK